MATIGLDRMYYAKIVEDDLGNETYETPVMLAKAISAELSIELAEAVLYADDSAAYVVKDFKSGTLNLGVDDIGMNVAQDLTGAVADDNGVLVSITESEGAPVAVGFRALKPDNKYRYFWLYRVKFGIPSTNLATKGDSITFQTPTISGTVMRRNRPDAQEKHPWKVEVTEGLPGTRPSVIRDWFNEVYEPVYNLDPEPVTVSVTLDPQGGEVVPSIVRVVVGEPFGELPTPIFAGHTFDGWYTQPLGGVEVTSSTLVDGAVLSLFAHWTEGQPQPGTVDVTLNAHGGLVEPETITATIGEPFGILPEPILDDHSFDGWFSEETDGEEITSESVVDGTITELHAQWTEE